MDQSFGISYKIYALREAISRAKMNVLRIEETLMTKMTSPKALRKEDDIQEPTKKRRRVDVDEDDITEDSLNNEILALRKVRRVYMTYIKTKHTELMKLKKQQPIKKQEVSRPQPRASGVLVF